MSTIRILIIYTAGVMLRCGGGVCQSFSTIRCEAHFCAAVKRCFEEDAAVETGDEEEDEVEEEEEMGEVVVVEMEDEEEVEVVVVVEMEDAVVVVGKLQ